MIKILILTDDKIKWFKFIYNLMIIDKSYETINEMHLENKLFSFSIRSNFPESLRGAAYSHVIQDKEIKGEDFYHLILPTIKQKVTQYGSWHILGE